MADSHDNPLRRWLTTGLLMACVGVALCAVVVGVGLEVLWRAYLFGLLTCWPVAIAAASLLALGNLTGGRWAAAARPFYLAAAGTLPLLAILSIPLAFALPQIYPWAHPTAAMAEELSPSKAAYLSPPFFLARSAAYWVVWLLVAWWISYVSRLNRLPATTVAMRRAGALSLVLLVPTSTFGAFDWAMSLEPHWYSSIYGALLVAGGVVAVHCLALASLAFMPADARHRLIAPEASGYEARQERTADVFGDLGSLLLAFIMLWTYFSFSQFLIIWSVNLPSEISWYLRRLSGGWQYVALAMVLICFALPFLVLLSRELKRNIRRLAIVAAMLLVGYVLNMYWTLVPAFSPVRFAAHVANLGALMALGGVWIAFYAWRLGRLAAIFVETTETNDQANG